MGGLEAAQELVEGVQHLLGEAFRDLILESAAVLKQRGQALVARQVQQAMLAQEQPQRGADRPARGLRHVRDAEVQPARTLAARRGDQAQRAAVEEEACRHTSLAQQPFHAAVRRGLKPAGTALAPVEVLAGFEHTHQELPGQGAVLRLHLAHGKIGAQGLVVPGQRRLKLGWDRATVDAGVALRREAPAQHLRSEGAEVGQPRDGPLPWVEDALLDASSQEVLPLGVAAVEDRARPHQGRGRDHKPGRLHETYPFEVGDDCRVEPCHQFVSGQR